MQNILIVADLGAASNLVRNILLLSNKTDWPLLTSRSDTISNQYLSSNFHNWLSVEYKLRFWNIHYGIDLSNNLNWQQYSNTNLLRSESIVFINHSAVWQHEEYKKFKNNLKILYVAPETEFGVKWQVRSYVEKKTPALLHNFSFNNDVDFQKNTFIKNNGIENYFRLNICNMFNIIKQRQQEFKCALDNELFLPLETIINGSPKIVVDFLKKIVSDDLDEEQAINTIESWRNLHWQVNETHRWKYYDCLT